MADPYKFPHIEPIPQFKEDKDFTKNEDRDFVGSIQKRVIATIKALRCANKCKDKDGQMRGIRLIIDDEHSPMTGYCGHHFCYGCAHTLYVKSEPSSRPSPKPIDVGNFEFDCALTSNSILYNCKSCDKEIKRGKKERHRIVRVFSENIMLGDIYTALKVHSGFHCKICKKTNLHPKFNSLHCVTCASLDVTNAYLCVWHVAEHLKHNETKFHHLITLDDKHKETSDISQFLSSLDRGEREVFAALYHCACCSTSLENDKDGHKPHRHLECGHFIGARCVKNARKKLVKRIEAGLESFNFRRGLNQDTEGGAEEGVEGTALQPPEGLFCNFCKNDPVKKSDLNVYPVFPPINKIMKKDIVFSYNLLECKDNCSKCEYTTCNTLFAYQRDQKMRNRCKWCQVEHLLRRDCKENNK